MFTHSSQFDEIDGSAEMHSAVGERQLKRIVKLSGGDEVVFVNRILQRSRVGLTVLPHSAVSLSLGKTVSQRKSPA